MEKIAKCTGASKEVSEIRIESKSFLLSAPVGTHLRTYTYVSCLANEGGGHFRTAQCLVSLMCVCKDLIDTNGRRHTHTILYMYTGTIPLVTAPHHEDLPSPVPANRVVFSPGRQRLAPGLLSLSLPSRNYVSFFPSLSPSLP